MRNIFLGLCAVALSWLASSSMASEPLAPKVYVDRDAVSFEGRFVHLRGNLPEKGARWCYWVTERRPGLYVYAFWVFEEYPNEREREGLFSAESWEVEIFDSAKRPEREVIFSVPSRFDFRGDVNISGNGCRVAIRNIRGLPRADGMTMRLLVPANARVAR